jgi:hypothetical protein
LTWPQAKLRSYTGGAAGRVTLAARLGLSARPERTKYGAARSLMGSALRAGRLGSRLWFASASY